MKIKITNNYKREENNKGKPKSEQVKHKEQEIDIKGDCIITNYGNDYKPSNAGDLTIKISGEKAEVIKGAKTREEDKNTAHFGNRNYSIFTAIAGMSDKDGKNKLTLDDLLALKDELENNKPKNKTLLDLGITKVLQDVENHGVITLMVGDNVVLRIDFELDKEKTEKKPETKTKNTNTKTIVNPKAENANNKKEPAKTTTKPVDKPVSTSKDASNLIPVQKLYSIIPNEYESYIKKAAFKAGVSEDFIRHLIFTEGDSKTKRAKLMPYYCKNGILTVGFGHTNLTDNSKGKNGNKVVEGSSISLKDAFEYLVADIKEHRRYTRNYIGAEKFDALEKSVQEGLIDRSFQAGQGGFLGATIKANIEQGLTTAVVARNLWVPSDIRRSAMRFLMVTNGMTKEEQRSAKKRFENLGHYQETVSFLQGSEKMRFINAYNSLG